MKRPGLYLIAGFAAVMSASPAFALQVQQITNPSADGLVTGHHSPAWLPNGQGLVTVAYYPDFVDPASGTVAVTLDGAPFAIDWGIGGRGCGRPAIDPAGGRMVCWAYIHLYQTALFVSHPGALPDPLIPDATAPAWAPDGQTVVVATPRGLLQFPLSGAWAFAVTQDPRDNNPAWSPDGSRLAYSSVENGTRDLWVRDMPAGPAHRLMADAAIDDEPTWSPDGSWIAFASDRGGSSQVWVVASTGGTPVLITEGRSPAWSPDGRSIAFSRGVGFGVSQVWIATDLPDWRLPVVPVSWTRIKNLYRAGP